MLKHLILILSHQLICIILLLLNNFFGFEKENVLLKFTVTKNGHHLVLSGSALLSGAPYAWYSILWQPLGLIYHLDLAFPHLTPLCFPLIGHCDKCLDLLVRKLIIGLSEGGIEF